METNGASLIDERDFATLHDDAGYSRYFTQLSCVCRRLMGCYGRGVEAKSHEAAVVNSYLQRLLATVQALRLKYTYCAGDTHRLWIDLTESGFPNAQEISQLEVDLQSRERRLVDLPPKAALTAALLDHLFRAQTDSRKLLQQLGERACLEMLDAAELVLPFTPGELVTHGSDKNCRRYVFSWACYDHATNRPYIHLMSFDHDLDAEALELGGRSWWEFVEAIRAEGSRAPDVGVLALAIDQALDAVHPKILKRICIGPLYSRLLLEGRPCNCDDQREQPLSVLLAGGAGREEDFILFFQDEIIFSKRQEISRGLFSPRGRVREVFAIEEADPECYARRASTIHRRVLLPHRLLQHMDRELCEAVRGFKDARKFIFDERGEVHGI